MVWGCGVGDDVLARVGVQDEGSLVGCDDDMCDGQERARVVESLEDCGVVEVYKYTNMPGSMRHCSCKDLTKTFGFYKRTE